jgi:CubicO group peptidase (beta-lactamase class C family)
MDLAHARSGLSAERLERITDHLNRNYIEPGKIAGCQVAVSRHGHLSYFKSFGLMDRERGKPMADDTIFRLYSMTKPVTNRAISSSTTRSAAISPSGATTRSGSPATATRWSSRRPISR